MGQRGRKVIAAMTQSAPRERALGPVSCAGRNPLEQICESSFSDGTHEAAASAKGERRKGHDAKREPAPSYLRGLLGQELRSHLEIASKGLGAPPRI